MVDASPVDEMTPEQLRDHNDRLREEVDREREERNFFQLERDKVNAFWEISKKQLDEAKATIRVKERELEDAEERHQVEIKVYKQKVKHLLYEHQSDVTELKQEGEWDIVLCVRACVRVCVCTTTSFCLCMQMKNCVYASDITPMKVKHIISWPFLNYVCHSV